MANTGGQAGGFLRGGLALWLESRLAPGRQAGLDGRRMRRAIRALVISIWPLACLAGSSCSTVWRPPSRAPDVQRYAGVVARVTSLGHADVIAAPARTEAVLAGANGPDQTLLVLATVDLSPGVLRPLTLIWLTETGDELARWDLDGLRQATSVFWAEDEAWVLGEAGINQSLPTVAKVQLGDPSARPKLLSVDAQERTIRGPAHGKLAGDLVLGGVVDAGSSALFCLDPDTGRTAWRRDLDWPEDLDELDHRFWVSDLTVLSNDVYVAGEGLPEDYLSRESIALLRLNSDGHQRASWILPPSPGMTHSSALVTSWESAIALATATARSGSTQPWTTWLLLLEASRLRPNPRSTWLEIRKCHPTLLKSAGDTLVLVARSHELHHRLFLIQLDQQGHQEIRLDLDLTSSPPFLEEVSDVWLAPAPADAETYFVVGKSRLN